MKTTVAMNVQLKMVGIAHIRHYTLLIQVVIVQYMKIVSALTFVVMVFWLMMKCTLVMMIIHTIQMDAAPSARLKEVTIVKEEIKTIEIIAMKLAEMDST
jgi:hypothetical protein